MITMYVKLVDLEFFGLRRLHIAGEANNPIGEHQLSPPNMRIRKLTLDQTGLVSLRKHVFYLRR